MPCYSPQRGCIVESPLGRRISFFRGAKGQGVSLPCGRCIGCRLERSRQWAVRLMHESEMHSEACFITLTYDPKFLPLDGSISVQHCQSFMKRLRARLAPLKVRFFLCGEYGEKLQRPHYHAIIFGYSFPDKVPLEVSSDYSLYVSAELTDLWGMGHCSIGAVTFDSARYVANYATKKIIGKPAAAHYSGRKPEFLLMSRRPGIGRSWIDKFPGDVYPSDKVIVKGYETRPPRYYDQVLEKRDPELLVALKKRREEDAGILEDYMLKSGVRISVAPSRNARRLAVRGRVAEAKARLKSRRFEVSND